MTSSSWIWWVLDRWQALFASFSSWFLVLMSFCLSFSLLSIPSFFFHLGARNDIMWRRRGIKFCHEIRWQVFDIMKRGSGKKKKGKWKKRLFCFILSLSFISIQRPSHLTTVIRSQSVNEWRRESISLLFNPSSVSTSSFPPSHMSPITWHQHQLGRETFDFLPSSF